jgi:hypothetical protein
MVAGFGVFQLTLFPALLVLGPYVAKTHFGGAGAWGILACQAAGSVVGGLAALRIRPSRPLITSLIAVGLLASGGLTAADIIWTTVIQRRLPEHALSRISSYDWLGSVALNPIGYALVGPLAGAIGVDTTLYTAAAINASATIAVALVPSVHAIRTT